MEYPAVAGKRNAILEAVYGYLKANPDSSLASTLAFETGDGDIDYRFYTYEAVQDAIYPHAVVSIVGDNSIGAFLNCAASTMEWQINCFSSDITEINDLAAACRDLYENAVIHNRNYIFKCAWEAVFGPIRTDDQQPWEVIVTFFSA
jgi:hypothetical protein